MDKGNLLGAKALFGVFIYVGVDRMGQTLQDLRPGLKELRPLFERPGANPAIKEKILALKDPSALIPVLDFFSEPLTKFKDHNHSYIGINNATGLLGLDTYKFDVLSKILEYFILAKQNAKHMEASLVRGPIDLMIPMVKVPEGEKNFDTYFWKLSKQNEP